MLFSRGWWVAFAAAPVAILAASPARAAEPLPHGVHLSTNGRYVQDLCDHDLPVFCMAHRMLPPPYRPGDSIEQAIRLHPLGGPQGLMGPPDVLAAYTIPSSSGAHGKIVAILDEPDSIALQDVNAYRTAYGIPALALCPGSGLPTGSGTPCFASVDESGGSVNANIGDAGGMFDGETSLDMDMISAGCPDCSILLVQFTQPLNQDLFNSATTAKNLGAAAVSISWGGSEGGGDSTGYTTPGHLVLAAAGDSGYLNGGGAPNFPASSPDVLGVGGTTLIAGSYQEVVWNDGFQGPQMYATGSGCSTEFQMPTFQTTFGASNFTGCNGYRDSMDVSAAAQFSVAGGQGGIASYIGTAGGWQSVIGTSAATPLVAAIFTRLGLTDAISADLGFVYKNATDFNDVTSGNNGSCGNIQCTAGPGWDGPTGLGSPNGSKLAPLGDGSSSSSGSSSGGSDGGSSSGADSGSGSGADSGSAVDSGVAMADSGSGSDSGSGNNDAPATQKGGCACTSVGVSAESDGLAMLAVGGIAMVLLKRRRR